MTYPPGLDQVLKKKSSGKNYSFYSIQALYQRFRFSLSLDSFYFEEIVEELVLTAGCPLTGPQASLLFLVSWYKIQSMNKKYFFLSGLPRSGSTLLAAILSQHPEMFVSVTSPLLDFMGTIEQSWMQAYQAYTCPFENHLKNISQGFLNGFYKDVEKPYVMDKSRGWPANIQKLKELLDESPKVICTVRDLPSVIASFYRVMEWDQPGQSNIDKGLLNLGQVLNKTNRCQHIWDAMVKGSWMSFKHGYSQFPDCIHLVEYDDLIEKPEETLESIYQFLEIKNFSHDLSNIEQPIVEDDSKWGIKDLHKIGRKLERQSTPAKSRIGEEIFNTYNQLKLEFWRV